jgi:hypothetical protein
VKIFSWAASIFAALSITSMGQPGNDERGQVMIERYAGSARSETSSETRGKADAWLDERVKSLKSKTDRTQEEQELLEEYARMLAQPNGATTVPL